MSDNADYVDNENCFDNLDEIPLLFNNANNYSSN